MFSVLLRFVSIQRYLLVPFHVRRPSSYSCIRVNTVQTTSDAVIEKLTKILNDDSEDGLKLVQPDGSSSPISKCQIPGLEYVVFVNGSGPHRIEYGSSLDNPPKEVLVSRKCAEAVLRGAQVNSVFDLEVL